MPMDNGDVCFSYCGVWLTMLFAKYPLDAKDIDWDVDAFSEVTVLDGK